MSTRGYEGLSEIIDDYMINQGLSFFKRLAPEQSDIMIDLENKRLFNNIYNQLPGKKILALVNHWNLLGIEELWRQETSTQDVGDFINPIGDFDLDEHYINNLENDILRRYKSKLAHSEPATSNNELFFYNKSHFEGERERHVFFDGYKDPELEHGLYNEENEGVKNLPYQRFHHH